MSNSDEITIKRLTESTKDLLESMEPQPREKRWGEDEKIKTFRCGVDIVAIHDCHPGLSGIGDTEIEAISELATVLGYCLEMADEDNTKQ